MGLFSNIAQGISNIAKATGADKVLDFATVAFTQPLATAKAVIAGGGAVKALEQKSFAQPLSTQITKTVVATAGYAAATLAAGGAAAAIAEKGIVGAATALIPATTKGKVIAAVAAPISLGAIISQPEKTLGAVASAPSALANFGGNVATLVAEPSVENLKNLVKENPVISTLAGAGVIATVGGGVGLAANTLATFTNSQATRANTAAGTGDIASSPVQTNLVPATSQEKQLYAMGAEKPITPATETISAGKTQYRARRRKKTPSANVNQRVNVIVSNKSISTGIRATKKYLNREVLFQ